MALYKCVYYYYYYYKYGVEVIRVTFNNWAEVDLCALLYIICMDSLHPAIPVGVRELKILGFDHPPRCPECVARSEEWLVISQRRGELSDGEKRDSVYSCLFPVCKWKNLHFSSSQDHSFVECLELYPGDSSCYLLI